MRPPRRPMRRPMRTRRAMRAMRWLGPPPPLMLGMYGPPPPHHPPPHERAQGSDPAQTVETRMIPSLPSQCPSCGRGLSMDSVDWNGPMSAACPACGSGIEVTWTEL